jgi:hypothetical protein
MNIYRLPQLSEANPDSRYTLGLEELKTESVYLVYGRLRPGEKGMRLSPTDGHEEIVYVAKGRLLVKGDRLDFPVGEGEAFHLKGADTLIVDNAADDHDAVYIAAGGLSYGEYSSEDRPETEEANPAEKDPKETAGEQGAPARREDTAKDETKARIEPAELMAAEETEELED